MQLSTKPKRKPFFRFIKCILRIFKRKPKFINLGGALEDSAIYVSNHVGANGPITLELYFPKNFRFWGTYEMCGGIKARWDYLAKNYFLKKKHNSKFVSVIKASLIAPFSGLFYKGMQLIPTYTDQRMIKTIEYSLDLLDKGTNILIFPENSSDGYHDELKEYYGGFYFLASKFYEKYQRDIKIYNMYFQRKKKTLVIDKAVSFLELEKKNLNHKEIAAIFKARANELSKM